MISRRAIVLSLLSVPGAGGKAQAQSLQGRYFVVVWGYEGASISPSDAHTFATFYRGDDLAQGNVHPATISWLPATGVLQFGVVEKGKNFSLGETLALARRRRYRVAAYGPYEIGAKTYSRAMARIRLLNSGRIAYTVINGPAGAMNCIEAAGSVGGPISTGLSYGFSASTAVAGHLASNRGQVDREAAARLNLGRYAAAQ